mmetsp:Transcript_25748/g.36913  ORF Transcript_25748/g.36913 Transcript_25748/m.36913 type:complete len:117 (-) Transcript_25748:335-685(-)
MHSRYFFLRGCFNWMCRSVWSMLLVVNLVISVFSHKLQSVSTLVDIQLRVRAGLIKDLPEVLMEAPPSKLQIQRPNSGLSQSSSESASINGGSYSMPPDNNVCAGNNQIVSYCAFS